MPNIQKFCSLITVPNQFIFGKSEAKEIQNPPGWEGFDSGQNGRIRTSVRGS